MEIPKHTTQVGTIAASKKFYLEDYCISYMKQLCEEYPGERKQIALFGTMQRDKSIEYAFVYGASLLGRGKGRTDSLTNSQKEEAESFRKEFFEEYQLLGVVISNDLVNENIYWIGNGSKTIPMDGYYIFYDTNEAMLNFMMKNQCEEREVDLDPVIVKKADMDREKRERAERQQQELQEKRGMYRKKLQTERKPVRAEQKKKTLFPAAACLLVLAICGIYGAKRYYPTFGFDQVTGYISGLWEHVYTAGEHYLTQNEEMLLPTEESQTLEIVQEETETKESESIVIVSADVAEPTEMDVVIIPDLEKMQEAGVIKEEPAKREEIPEAEVKPKDPEPEPVIKAEPEKYLIQKGDNLLRILRFHYGDESKLSEICDVNGIADPNNIQVGQTILLP